MSTLTDPLFPYATLFRSGSCVIGDPVGVLLLLLLLLLLIVVPAFAGMTIWKVGSQLNLRAYRFNNRPSQCRGDTAFVPVPFSASSPLPPSPPRCGRGGRYRLTGSSARSGISALPPRSAHRFATAHSGTPWPPQSTARVGPA